MEGSANIADPILRYPSLRIATGFVVALLAASALLFGAFWMLMAVLCFHNFHLSRIWDCFALVYTFGAPIAAVAGYFLYFLRPAARTAIIAITVSLSVAGIYFIWTADASLGFMH